LPAEFPNSSTSPAQQRPPYTVPGSIPRPGPPSWQGPPPGTQFRPQGVPQPSSGAPPTLANALSNPISPFQSGSYQRPVAGRPPGPPAVFQPSQPSLGAPPPFQPPTLGLSSQADGSWPPVSNPNSASVGFSPKASSTGGSPFSNVSPVPSMFGGSIPPPPTSSSLGSGFPISSAYPASSTPVTSFPRPPQVASGPGARPPFYAPGPYNLPPTGHQFSSAPPQQPPPSSFGPSPPSFGAPPQFGTPTPPQFGGTTPSQGYYSTGPPPPPPTTPGIYAGEGQKVGPYGAPPLAGGYGANLQQPAQGLVEDFQSLSLVPLPGSVESAVDPGMLPRPLDSPDVKSTGAMNCNPRYLRLSTNAMPNSHSLVARWHLPLGAVVHPLAEAPPGVCPNSAIGKHGIFMYDISCLDLAYENGVGDKTLMFTVLCMI
jgi:protein transport protein SEC24